MQNTIQETAKERFIKIIQEQPDDMDAEEILKELAFHQMIQRGITDVDEGRVLSHEQVENEVRTWGK